jgi:meso-butanediol dehydrogenase/(S,S)-butanediol dehydrogenase/diacetyl reductase
MDVTDKIALVTGGACNIGRTITATLARRGAHVLVGDIVEDAFEEIRKEIQGYGRQSMTAYLDVTDGNTIKKMVEEAISRFGRIDILVNNAGVIAAPGWADRDDTTEEDWDITHSINVKGVATVSNAVIPHMKEARYGKIVNIASVAGKQATVINPPYAVSKAGVISLTRTMAMTLAPYNINVNAVCPGLLWTPMWEKIAYKFVKVNPECAGLSAREIFDKSVATRVPLQRPQTPEDVAHLVAFLASEAACNITGQAINVDGGSRTD